MPRLVMQRHCSCGLTLCTYRLHCDTLCPHAATVRRVSEAQRSHTYPCRPPHASDAKFGAPRVVQVLVQSTEDQPDGVAGTATPVVAVPTSVWTSLDRGMTLVAPDGKAAGPASSPALRQPRVVVRQYQVRVLDSPP